MIGGVALLVVLFGTGIVARNKSSRQNLPVAEEAAVMREGRSDILLATPTAGINPDPVQESKVQSGAGYIDVIYKSSFPEMQIPVKGQVICNFRNGDVVTIAHEVGGLHITSTISREDFLATVSEVLAADTNLDGWVKLVAAGNISVAYDAIAGQWKTDWLRGCPPAIRTPQP